MCDSKFQSGPSCRVLIKITWYSEGVTKFLKPSVRGFLLQKELGSLVGAVSNPKSPFAAGVGGSKVSSKIGGIELLLEQVDILLLGGEMIFTSYKAQGLSVGLSLVEEDKSYVATSLLEEAKAKGVSLLLPSDDVCCRPLKSKQADLSARDSNITGGDSIAVAEKVGVASGPMSTGDGASLELKYDCS
ncbi:phosphoglycerate kinase, chloroplastic-like [Coffea arabica]|uniref:Phosphoglycerate kinase n=1 Tax=Coffea arabica TaxID=13443 RepID=A0ABM4V6W4_COFAR